MWQVLPARSIEIDRGRVIHPSVCPVCSVLTIFFYGVATCLIP